MTRRVTTFDIAREAGVSRTTVSHILNSQPGVHLSAKTKARVHSGYAAMKRLLTSNFRATALFAGNDTIAIGAMRAIRETGLSIPRDFAVVGYDDVPSAAFACPPLTTVRTHAYEHGKLFAEAAIKLMDKEEVGSQQDALPLELIIRESCGAKAEKVRPVPDLVPRKS